MMNAGTPASAVAAPKRRVKTSGAATKVADVVSRARKMRAQGLISDAEHKQLMAKAEKVMAMADGAA